MPAAVQSESTMQRPISLRMRPDLSAQSLARHRYWAVKDPVSLRYFRLQDEEYAVLKMLDGRTSAHEIRQQFAARFAPRSLGAQELQAFLATLHRDGLLLSEARGQGEQLLIRRDGQRRRERFQGFAGLLAIRLRGFPSLPLDFLAPKCGFLFSPACVVASLVLMVSAALLVAVEFETVRARLPQLRGIVLASNLPWLVLILAATKIVHELAHGVACRRFGGDCHEMGVMLLVFTPCLYCNVSDAWMIPSRWQRIMISAAGMYVELTLASICTFLWWFSQPGLFNALCLNTVLVCSVGTLLFNGNPLLRYDGYFILSDLVEVPNLAAQSTAAARRLLGHWCLGWQPAADGEPVPARRQELLALYAVASTAYRWLVVVVVLWGLNEIARHYRVAVLVIPVAVVTVASMLWPVVAGAVLWARDPGRRRRIALARAGLTGVLLVVGIVAVVAVPLPMWSRCR